MEQNAIVQRALDALRAVCVSETAMVWISCRDAVEQHSVSVPAFQSKPLCAPAGWFVNGRRETVFPHCPRCASYALYRKGNIGDYECQTCGLQSIEESSARRLQ